MRVPWLLLIPGLDSLGVVGGTCQADGREAAPGEVLTLHCRGPAAGGMNVWLHYDVAGWGSDYEVRGVLDYGGGIRKRLNLHRNGAVVEGNWLRWTSWSRDVQAAGHHSAKGAVWLDRRAALHADQKIVVRAVFVAAPDTDVRQLYLSCWR